ncbi:hypothetical protein HHX47_DHR7000283 [Lentinula edodes]|nr:hypothetical protein HHX47_DHR7000283 [Lentinula edodes]
MMIPTHQKGKNKAQDFDDLDPVITYRHILQNNLGIKDPLRVVALCDSDAFYAACEMVRLGVTDKPLVVLQWEGIIAVNYPARKFGISRFQKLKDAKERCPELMIVHVATYKEGDAEPGYWDNVDSRTHKVSLDYYRRESSKVFSMLKEGLPDAEIEKASIDEAFIDFTKPIPADAPNGVDTPLPPPPPIDWGTDSHLIPIYSNANSESTDEETSQSAPLTWHDIALRLAAEMMHKVRVDIAAQLGYTTSAIRFLGGKLGQALAKEYDVSTVADLLPVPLEEFQAKFGESAIWVYEILRKERPNLWPKTLALHAGHGYGTARSKQAPFPFTKEVTVNVIAAAGGKLWKELVGNVTGTIRITYISLGFTGIEATDASQQSIASFLDSHAVTGVKRPNEEKNECHKTLSLSPKLLSTSDVLGRAYALAALKDEHSDFHFAESVAREMEPEVKEVRGPHKKVKTPMIQEKEIGPRGIEKFFNRT